MARRRAPPYATRRSRRLVGLLVDRGAQRPLEGLGGQDRGAASSSTRKSGSTPAANACWRRTRAQKPCTVEISTRSASRAEDLVRLGEPRADARHELLGRALGVGHDEDPLGVEAALDRERDALDEDGRLAGAGAGQTNTSPRPSTAASWSGVSLRHARRPGRSGTRRTTSDSALAGVVPDVAAADAADRAAGVLGRRLDDAQNASSSR